MRKILVPCDFSKPAINAFRTALDLAQKSNGMIHLLNVIELPAIHDPIIMPVITLEKEFIKELKDKTILRFDKIIDKYNTDGIAVKMNIDFGSPGRLIMEFAKKRSIDIIVMGTHGTTGIREYFMGSNAEKVVRLSKIPVLVTKSYSRGEIRNIVFPNTLETENHEDLVARVKELQAFFKAKVHIVYINTPATFTADNVTMNRLKEFAKAFGFRNYTLNVYNYIQEEAGIIHFTKSIKGDLIAMGTHGRQGIAHLLNGSLAEDLANHADTPIWTYTIHERQ